MKSFVNLNNLFIFQIILSFLYELIKIWRILSFRNDELIKTLVKNIFQIYIAYTQRGKERDHPISFLKEGKFN